MPCFIYGETELQYLKEKDAALGRAIDLIGQIKREVIPDLFGALVHSIIGQQISTKAQVTIWNRIKEAFPNLSPEDICAVPTEKIQSFGITMRKAGYIREAALRIAGGELCLEELNRMGDAEVCKKLCSLPGVGVWTAEMLMIFSMQRPDVLSFGDLAIQRGLRMLYGCREIDKEQFEVYRKRYSPYATTASLYLWAIAGGAIEGLCDPAGSGK